MLALAERLQQRQDLVQGRGLAARSAPRTVRQRKVAVVYASVDASDVDRSVPAQRSPQASQASRLRNSPAYKRLMNSSWHDTYKKNEGGARPASEPAADEPTSAAQGTDLSQASSSQPQTSPGTQAPGLGGRTSLGLGQGSVPWPKAQQQRSGAEQQQGSQQPAASTANPPQSAPAQTVRRTSADAMGARTRFGGGVSRPMTRVRFWLNWHVEYGQAIRVVGSHENLGAWQLSEALQLQWSEGDQWTAVAELPAGRILEYKYVLVDSSNSQGLSWQQGNNSVLALRQDDREVEVYDNWAGGPGAAVIAAGKSSTRENRLVAWAEDIERLVASQRGELRRSRMELIAAQDDARAAREETRRLKSELAVAEAARQEDKMRVRELETMNKLLRSQLQDSAASFRAALETAQKYLREAEQKESPKPRSSSTDAQVSPAPETTSNAPADILPAAAVDSVPDAATEPDAQELGATPAGPIAAPQQPADLVAHSAAPESEPAADLERADSNENATEGGQPAALDQELEAAQPAATPSHSNGLSADGHPAQTEALPEMPAVTAAAGNGQAKPADKKAATPSAPKRKANASKPSKGKGKR